MKTVTPNKRNLTIMLAGLLIAGTAATTALAEGSGNINPGVLRPQSHPYGKSYGEWAAAYWQWLFSFPDDQSPAYEQGDIVFGTLNQSGPVWILESGNAGTWARNVRVPVGKGILLSLAGGEVDTLFFPGATDDDLLGILDAVFNDLVIHLQAEVNGVPIQNLDQHFVTSPPFEIIVPNPGLAGTPSGTGQARARGWFLLLAPLPKGEHTVHVHFNAPGLGPLIGDTTYDITVQ